MTTAGDDLNGANADPYLRRVMVVLSLLILLGVIGTSAAVLGGVQARAASRADVERTNLLVQQLTLLQTVSDEDRGEHRLRNEAIHADLCRLIYEVVLIAPSLRDQGIQPCGMPLEEADGEVVDDGEPTGPS